MKHPDCAGRECVTCARRRKANRIARERGYPTRPTVDVGPVREHLLWLAARGIGTTTVSTMSGIPMITIDRVRYRQQVVTRRVAEAILAVQPEQVALVRNAGRIDGTASRLRLQALTALGYRQQDIARMLGHTCDRPRGVPRKITRGRALALLDLCRKVGDRPGPSRRAAGYARNRGWRPPADFDEELFYSPHWDGTEPCRSPQSVAVTGAQSYLEEWDFLATYGLTPSEIAQQIGVTENYLRVLLNKRERGSIHPPVTQAKTA